MGSLDLRGNLARVGRVSRSGNTWHGMAFVVEALLLLLFLTFSLAVFFALLGGSYTKALENQKLEGAVVAATSAAERFAAAPTSATEIVTVDDYELEITSSPQTMDGGVLYHAEIVVYLDGVEQYRMNTARYVSEVAHGN